jgi:hypothetical protein
MTTEKYMTMAAFARHVGVTKVTVLTWKKRGHLVFGPDRKHLDVPKSIECLKARPTKFRGGETRVRATAPTPPDAGPGGGRAGLVVGRKHKAPPSSNGEACRDRSSTARRSPY